jgi:hypothetical protein
VAPRPTGGAVFDGEFVGAVTIEQLRASFDWFKRGYEGYAPRPEAVGTLRRAGSDVTLEVFFGVWCGDSRRQVPKLIRTLDSAAVSPARVRLIGLSDTRGEYKRSPGGAERTRLIHRTPTVVVLKDGVEIGRIVETPEESVEVDLARIVSGHGAPSRYGAEAWIHELFTTLEPGRARAALASPRFLTEVARRSDPDSLWHYAEHDLMKNGRVEDAVALLEAILRRESRSVRALVNLAEALETLGRLDPARAAATRALELSAGENRAHAVLSRLAR